MTAMDYLPSDLEHMNTNFLDMIESDANSQLFDIENLNSDKFNGILSGDLFQETSQLDFENQNINENNWLQSFQWSDISKVPQSLIDASGVENNNPNLMVNPQSVLPMHLTQLVHNNNMTEHLNHVNAGHGIAVKINGHDAVLTPTHHRQIQHVTVRNLVSLNNHHIGYAIRPITICSQQVKSIETIIPQSLTSPTLNEHLQNSIIYNNQQINNKNREINQPQKHEKVYPKPVYSYSCLIAMALKNSRTGNLPVCEIYNFMIDNFPYFKTAPDGWKNSVRHNLSLNKCFAKVYSGTTNGTHTRKGCLWALNPAKVEKMEEEIVKWRKKDPESVKLSMSKPENLELIEQGKAGPPHEADEPCSPVKQEPCSVHVTPMKQHCQVQPQSSIQTNSIQSKTCRRELAVVVKTEPEIDIMTVKDVNQFGPSVPDMVLQNDLWDEELTIGVGYPTSWSTMCPSPVMSPALHSNSQYHGNITYTCDSPEIVNLTPIKPYLQTPTKLHLHMPSKLVIA